MARNDAVLKDYVRESFVRAGGRLTVGAAEGSRGGLIQGGEAFATAGIEARTIGYPSGSPTVVGISPDLQAQSRLKKAQESLQFCENNIMRIFRTLGVSSADSRQISALLRRTPPWRRRPIVELLQRLKQLVAHREEASGKVRLLQAEAQRALGGARIRVYETIHRGTVVKLGAAQRTLSEQLDHVVVSLSGNDVSWIPLADDPGPDDKP
jgi:hypothetical protein